MAPLSQAPSCLLLNRVPREIRDMVYRSTFEGAKVVQEAGTTTFRATGQWQLLLTCRQAYDEARPVFCAEIRMDFKICSPLDLNKNVSDFTKARVRHLGLVQELQARRILVRDFNRWPHDEDLCGFERAHLDRGAPWFVPGQFPSLQTCILPTVTRQVRPEYWGMSEKSMLAEKICSHLLGSEPWSTASFRKLGDDEWEVVCNHTVAISEFPDETSHGWMGPQACLTRIDLDFFARGGSCSSESSSILRHVFLG